MYFCTTDNCAISLSKATFPVAMNCPVCQIPLQLAQSESVLSEQEQTLIDSLPYVIAYPLNRALEEKHAWTKINLLKDTFLNYLKYLGLLSASEFFNSDLKNRRMVDAFQKNLAQPSFGSWNAFIRECISFLKEQNHVFFYPELVAYYEKIETGKKRKIYKGEIEYIDSNGDVQLKKLETTAIGLLINFRNRYLGHGLTLDEQASTQLWEEYFPVFKSILEQMSFSREYPMYKREHGETYLLQGAELKENNTTNILDGSIWLENKKGEAFEILPFYIVPGALALAKEDKEQVLSYESYTGKTIKFFSPEGSEKQTSGFILEKLNLLLRNKQKETTFSPETFTKEVFINRIEEENKLVIDTLIQEKKVIEGIYQNRETIEIKLREWIGARANIFFIAAEAGSGKTNLLVEIQKQYAERQLPSLFIRAARMEKSSLKDQIAYQLNLDPNIDLKEYTCIAVTQAESTFILIDGLNEASNAEAIWNEVLEISTLFEPGSVKFVITNRANSKSDLERYHLSEEQEQFIYNESLERDKEQGLASHVFWLTPMDMSEMEGAWDAYVKKDKGRFNPLFSFNDLATFDRGLYLQINNPLVLRIFLETYQGKNLPKGTKQLHIWKDWFATFSENEQLFMRLLAEAIWEKGENELELEELLKNEQLKAFILTDNISGPYNRLLNLGWVSRYHKDLTIYVSFTVEGLLFYLLGVKLDQQIPSIEIDFIENYSESGTKIQKSAIQSYLNELAIKGDLNLITSLIDKGNDYIDFCIEPVIIFLKTFGIKETIKKLLENPTENDWKTLLKLDSRLSDLELYILRKDFLKELMPENRLQTKQEVWLGLKAITLFDNEIALEYFLKIDTQSVFIQKDSDLLFELGGIKYKFSNYDKAIEIYEKSKDIFLKYIGEDQTNIAKIYNKIGMVWNSKGNYEKALQYYKKSIEINKKSRDVNHISVANNFDNIGSIWLSNGDFNRAIEHYEKSLEIKLKHLGFNHSSIAFTYHNIGQVYYKKGDNNKALKYYEIGFAINSKTFKKDDPIFSVYYNDIALVFKSNWNLNRAIEFLQKSLEINLKSNGENHKSVGIAYNNLAECFMRINNYDKSIEYFEKSLLINSKIMGYKNDLVATIFFNLGQVWQNKNDYDKAIENYNKSIKCYNKAYGDKLYSIGIIYGNIGNLLQLKRNYKLAIKKYKKGYDILKKGGFTFQIAECYEALNDQENALDYFIQSAVIRKEDPEVGLEAESTQKAISNAKRLAKDLGKEEGLPEWFK